MRTAVQAIEFLRLLAIQERAEDIAKWKNAFRK